MGHKSSRSCLRKLTLPGILDYRRIDLSCWKKTVRKLKQSVPRPRWTSRHFSFTIWCMRKTTMWKPSRLAKISSPSILTLNWCPRKNFSEMHMRILKAPWCQMTVLTIWCSRGSILSSSRYLTFFVVFDSKRWPCVIEDILALQLNIFSIWFILRRMQNQLCAIKYCMSID